MRPLLLLLSLLASTAIAEPARTKVPPAEPVLPGRVDLPFAEWERLHALEERSPVTVIERASVRGSFAKGDLTLTLAGRASGQLAPAPFLVAAPALRLFDCQGDGLVARGAAHFELTPLANRFQVTCRLSAAGGDRLELVSTPQVLWLEGTLPDGLAIAHDEGDGRRTLTLVRTFDGDDDARVQPSATARYRLTLEPERSEFRYRIEVRNPSRAARSFDVTLASGEHVQKVESAAPYTQLDGEEGRRILRFQVLPGDAALTLEGTLDGTRFTPPLEATVQYLLLESHPLLHAEVATPPKRVSPTEVGMESRYRGAQAFLLAAKESVNWKATQLEALRSTSWSALSVQHTWFISADGPVLGESRIDLDNLGAPEVAVPMRAEPTYAAVEGESLFLTRNAAGDLWLPLSPGKQAVEVQHRQSLEKGMGLAWGPLWLPQLAVPSTQSTMEIRYPREWVPLVERFGGESRWHGMGWGQLAATGLLVAGWMVLLGALGVGGGVRLLVLGLLALGAHTTTEVAALAWVALMAGAGLAFAAKVHLFRSAFATLLAGGAALVFAGLVAVPTLFQNSVRNSVEGITTSADRYVNLANGNAKADWNKGNAIQGLPARLSLPSGHERSTFRRELLSTAEPRAIRVLLVSREVAGTIEGLLSVLLLLALASQRNALRDGVLRWLGEASRPA